MTNETVAQRKSDLKRFWAKVDKNGPFPSHVNGIGRCWEWLGNRKAAGYGMFSYKRKTVAAHRWIFESVTGKKLGRLDCCHKCDNECCVRPSHLFSGTRSDNVRDSVVKGRHRNMNTGKIICMRGHSLSGNNVRWTKDGWRKCIACEVINNKAKWIKYKSPNAH